jgi:hypothetical protein
MDDTFQQQHPPLMEMSQDIIGWDESNNVDLRQIARSPMEDSGGASSRTNKNTPLDGLKRRLNDTTPDFAPSPFFRTQPSTEKSLCSKKKQSEQEIDGILSILQKEDEHLGPLPNNANAATPRASGNNHPSAANAPRVPPSASIAPFKSVTSLAARHRQRRRREMEENLHPNNSKRPHISVPLSRKRTSIRGGLSSNNSNNNNNSDVHSPKPTLSVTNNHHKASLSSNNETESEGGDPFEALLKQMSTPQSDSKHIRPTSNECHEVRRRLHPGVTQEQTSSSTQQQLNSAPVGRTFLGADTTKQQPWTQPHRPQKSLAAAAAAANQQGATIHPPAPQQQASRRLYPPPPSMAKDAPNNNIRPWNGGSIMPPPTAATTNAKMNSPENVPPKMAMAPNSITTRNRNGSRPNAPPATTTSTSTTTTSNMLLVSTMATACAVSNDDKDDEFGDLNFSAADFANIDSLISTQQIQGNQTKQQVEDAPIVIVRADGNLPPNDPPPHVNANVKQQLDGANDEFGDFPDIDFAAMDETIVRGSGNKLPRKDPSLDVNVHIKQPDANDEFGDFPDIDFAAMDEKIVRGGNKLPPKDPPLDDNVHIKEPDANDEFGDFPDIDFAAMDEKIIRGANLPPKDPSLDVHVHVKQLNANDEFGDFPDFDFAAIDEKIAMHSQAIQIVAAPPILGLVKNSKTNAEVTELAFLTFSRYKVLSVEDDHSTYTKTLSIAAWRSYMLREEHDEKRMHRNVKVAHSDSCVLDGDDGSESMARRRNLNFPADGCIYLRGEWYYTLVSPGDILHLCSLTGRYRTEASALPIILHTDPPPGSDIDDLVLVMHPDLLMTPTLVSETVGCSRRAVLKSRLGSTGLTSKAALYGTMRHGLFEQCMKEKNFTLESARIHVQKIVLKNAEGLIGCGVSATEAESEVIGVLPHIRRFADQYTLFRQEEGAVKPASLHNVIEGHGNMQPDINLMANAVKAIEEPVISPELALKGNIDAIFTVTTSERQKSNGRVNQSGSPGQLEDAFICLELKTGHNQKTQNAHMAQLALYTLMLQTRHGTKQHPQSNQGPIDPFDSIPKPNAAATGGILLYLNHESLSAVHVSPMLNEIKSLLGQRNVVACELSKSSRPRGVVLGYEDERMDDGESAGRR